MTHNRLKKLSGGTIGTATVVLLFLMALTPGCGQQKTAKRADEEKSFLAPTDLSKLRPEAREALRRMPGGDKAPPANNAASTSK